MQIAVEMHSLYLYRYIGRSAKIFFLINKHLSEAELFST